jgi:DNA-binding transcriptional LysR family regulator
VAHEGRSQEIFERRLSELNLDRRILLRSPHFMSVPLLVATSDMITVVPRAVGLFYARLASLKLVEPPIDIPPIELKQFWHRRAHNDPGVVWLRKLIARLFMKRDRSVDPSSPVFGS